MTGPGFINIHLNKQYVSGQVTDILARGVRPPSVGVKGRAVVDFSSPNIAKEMHVGHLRLVLSGISLTRLDASLTHQNRSGRAVSQSGASPGCIQITPYTNCIQWLYWRKPFDQRGGGGGGAPPIFRYTAITGNVGEPYLGLADI